jgi:hypothetical protein
VIDDEAELPFERPPLSQEYFAGEKTFERILIRPSQFWEDRQITIITNTHITSVDAETASTLTNTAKPLCRTSLRSETVQPITMDMPTMPEFALSPFRMPMTWQ